MLNWDFYEEYLPALAEISENPPLEDLAMAFFSAKKKADKIKIPKRNRSKEDRKKAFEEVREKTKEWRQKHNG